MHFTQNIVKQFVTESKNYLATIEDDLYDLEKHKHNPDGILVDKIFRVHHTIKEGAAFLGLNNINDLASIMENMFSLIRAGEVKPEPVVVAALLEGSNCLNDLLDDVERSNEADISYIYRKLSKLLSGEVSEKVKHELETNVALSDTRGEKTGFEVNRFILKNLTARNKSIYVLKYDLMELANREHLTPLRLIRQLLNKGEIVEGRLVSVLEDLHAGLPSHPLIYEVLYAAAMDLRQLQDATGLSQDDIAVVKKPLPGDESPKGYRPFEVFRDFILPELCDRAGNDMHTGKERSRVRIWNVGTPTGLELYIIALLVHEYLDARGVGISIDDFSILSTDASAEELSKAIVGKFNDGDLEHTLLSEKKSDYFRREGGAWYICDHIRSLIDFRQVDHSAPFRLPGKFDVIFCNNVLKTPDSEAAKKTIVDRFHAVLSENGFLFPGEHNRLTGVSGRFKPIKYGETIVYKKIKERE